MKKYILLLFVLSLFFYPPDAAFSQVTTRFVPNSASGLTMSSSFLVSGDVLDVQADTVAQKVYVVDGWGLLIFSISPAGEPVLLGTCPTRGTASSVCVFAGSAYIADRDSILKVIDISDPQAPQASAEYAASGRIYSVSVSDSLLFLSLGEKGVEIAQIPPSGSPVRKGIFNPRLIDASSFVSSVKPVARKGYLACGTGGLWIIDAQNPAAPATLGHYTPTAGSYYTWSVDTVDSLAFLANGYAGIEALIVSNPQNIRSFPSLGGLGNVLNVKTKGRKVLAACGTGGGLKIISGEIPASLSKIGEAASFGQAASVSLLGQKALLADGEGGLYVFDVSNLSLPAQTGRYEIPGKVNSGDWIGNMLGVAHGDAGLKLYDVTSPSQPQLLGSLKLPGRALNVRLLGSHALAACGDSGLVSVDISIPASPVVSGRTLPGMPAVFITRARDIALVALGDSGMAIIDVQNPGSISVLSRIRIGGFVYGISASGSHAYLACGESTLTVVDIADSTNPAVVGRFRTPGDITQGIAANGNFAYLANDLSGVLVVNVSNPASPVLVGTLPEMTQAIDVLIKEPFLYAAAGAAGIYEYSLGSPQSPSLTAVLDTPAWAGSMSSGPGRNIFVGDYDDATLFYSDTTPVNMVDFQAEQSGGGIALTWHVYSPEKFISFNIYRKENGQTSPAQIARIDKTAKENLFLDEDVSGGILEYTLGLVDGQGNETMSRTVTVDLNRTLHQGRNVALTLWPSASRGSFTAEIYYPVLLGANTDRKFSLRLFDSMGRQVGRLLEGTLNPGVTSYRVNARPEGNRPIASGVYFVVLETGNQSAVKKFVVIR